MRIILITTFHESSGMKQNEEALISPMQLPHSSAVKPETLIGYTGQRLFESAAKHAHAAHAHGHQHGHHHDRLLLHIALSNPQ